jgi:nitrite reductase/ring-hydroxylating ferredoxin subunit
MIRLCKTSEVAPGTVKRIEVPGLPPLAVFNLQGNIHVTDDTCTHGLASLSEGYIDGDVIECPWHSGRFSILTGEPVGFPVIVPISVYRVEVVGDEIYIEPPEQSSPQPMSGE